MPPRARVRVPYLYNAIKLLLNQEMLATCDQIHQEVGYTVQAITRITGYASWVYIGALQDGCNIIDHNNVAGKEEAMATYMKVRSQLSVSHQDYCLAMNEFMHRRGCHMTKFLRSARVQQIKLTRREADANRAHKKTTWKLVTPCALVSSGIS